jgi:hypothetical protein
LSEFTSTASCPYGAGCRCLTLEKKYIVVFTNTANGVAWLR